MRRFSARSLIDLALSGRCQLPNVMSAILKMVSLVRERTS